MTAGGAWRRPRMKVYDYNQEFGGNYYQVSQIFLSRGLHNIQRTWHSAFWAFAFSIHDRWYLLKTFLYIFFCFEGLSWSQYSLRGLSINLTSFFYVLNFVTKTWCRFLASCEQNKSYHTTFSWQNWAYKCLFIQKGSMSSPKRLRRLFGQFGSWSEWRKWKGKPGGSEVAGKAQWQLLLTKKCSTQLSTQPDIRWYFSIEW